MNEVRETLCTRCIHSQVCAHTEYFEKLLKLTDKMQADANDYNKMFKLTLACNCYQGRRSYKSIKDIPLKSE